MLLLAETSWLESAWAEARAAASGGPWTPVALAVAAAVAGLVMWLFGAGIVRPVVRLITVLAAAFVGYALFPRLGVDAPQWLGAAGGGIAGLILSGLVFRATTALLLAAMMALAAPAAVGVFGGIDLRESPARSVLSAPEVRAEGEAAAADRARDRDARRGDSGASSAEKQDLWKRTGEVVGRAGYAAAGVIDEWRAWWLGLDAQRQTSLLLAAVAAGALGLALGVLFPTMAATVATAGLGAAAWMWAGTWLAFAMSAPKREMLPAQPSTWLMLWAGVALLGAIIQTGVPGRRSRTPAKPAQAPPAAA